MKHVFYILVFLQIIYEMAKVIGCRKLHRETEAIQAMDKTAREWYLWANPLLGIALILDAVLFEKPILNVKGKLSFWNYNLED